VVDAIEGRFPATHAQQVLELISHNILEVNDAGICNQVDQAQFADVSLERTEVKPIVWNVIRSNALTGHVQLGSGIPISQVRMLGQDDAGQRRRRPCPD
jgi:hypothetical protein